MNTKLLKSSISCLLLTLPLSIGVLPAQAQSSSFPTPLQISQTFKPPKRPGYPSSAGAATRGSCSNENKEVKPLIPQNRLGLTFSERPTFFWYQPEKSAKVAQFLLSVDADTVNENKVLYETTIKLPEQAGIVGYTLPENAPTLEVGKTYRWYLTLICDESDSSGNPRVNGWVERIEPENQLLENLNKANFRKLPSIYAEAGIWHEALLALTQLRTTEPDNIFIRMDWRKFMKSVELQELTDEPIIPCCTTEN
ncbi:MAG TPA: DUF928 domain-containing protein [Nostocaceae cyanobacterium]|nr:DUF928 domain-containing protein [Nostocaceae cyanobacterium]